MEKSIIFNFLFCAFSPIKKERFQKEKVIPSQFANWCGNPQKIGRLPHQRALVRNDSYYLKYGARIYRSWLAAAGRS